MRMISLGFGALLAANALAIVPEAAYSEPPPTVQPAGTNTSGAPLICRYYYYNGHVLARRDCRTEAQWRRMREDNQQSISNFQLQSLQP